MENEIDLEMDNTMTFEMELFLVSFPKTIKILSLALCISSDENVKTGGFIS